MDGHDKDKLFSLVGRKCFFPPIVVEMFAYQWMDMIEWEGMNDERCPQSKSLIGDL